MNFITRCFTLLCFVPVFTLWFLVLLASVLLALFLALCIQSVDFLGRLCLALYFCTKMPQT